MSKCYFCHKSLTSDDFKLGRVMDVYEYQNGPTELVGIGHESCVYAQKQKQDLEDSKN